MKQAVKTYNITSKHNAIIVVGWHYGVSTSRNDLTCNTATTLLFDEYFNSGVFCVSYYQVFGNFTSDTTTITYNGVADYTGHIGIIAVD